MRKHLPALLRAALSVLLLACAFSSKASHLYGADLFYTYLSGNNYRVTLVIYGDCNLTNPPFTSLPSATPEIDIYNGTFYYTTITLGIQSPSAGEEVTPVCPSQLNNTTCVSTSGTIPGVKKFTYTGTVNLGSTSTNWRFRFTGVLGFTASAGRSNTLTNVLSGSITGLEATLNNAVGPNSSPTYTTIPTPFFCINKAASYNPGTVDANGDGLTYSLVPGINGPTFTNVSYTGGYSGTNPLAATGFSFSSTTGQLNFTPNLVQRSLVVSKVEEYRGTTLVGSSMREMTFVVLNNCNNNPPGGSITNLSGGVLNSPTTATVCQNQGAFSFNINPVDLDGNNINVAVSGIPAGASFNIVNNNTSAPSGTFSWSLSGVTPGTYNFFITYTDNGCPLSSKQTVAYSITVIPAPFVNFSLISPATCSKKAKFNITPTNSTSPYTITVTQGTTVLHTFTNVTATQQDSLSPGVYTISVTGTNNCTKDTSITINPPPAIIPSVSMVSPTCTGGNNGSITVTVSGGLAPFQYAIGSGSYSSTNTFTGLSAGFHTLHIKDGNDCIKDTTVELLDKPGIVANIVFTKPPCNFYMSGAITVTASNGTAPYQYAFGAGPFGSTNSWSGLASGNYMIHIKDANGCLKDSLFKLPDSIQVHAPATLTHVLCFGNATGAITLNAFGATAPYQYKLGSGSFGSTNTWTNLTAGSYTFRIEDVNNCYLDTIVDITQPFYLGSTSVVTHVSCNGLSDGTITTTGTGGVPPYTYAIGAGLYSGTNAFTGLAAGPYTVHVKDNNGCIHDTTITITQPPVLGITNVVEVRPSCFGYGNGSYTINANGGTPPYTYAYDANPYNSSNLINGLVAGTYTLHVKDNNGCIKDTTVTLTEPTAVDATVSIKNSTCATLANGRAELTASGGTPPYTYAINASPYSSSNIITPIAAGLHILHVRDNNGCIKDIAINIIDSINVVSTAVVTDANCFGDANGVIVVTPGGGLAPYTFAKGILGTFTPNNTFNGLLALTYLIRIKDANGCIKDTNIVVNEPTKLIPQVNLLQNIACYGFNDGRIDMGATGGTPGYTYAIKPGPYNAATLFLNLYPGTYLMSVKDSHGCIADTSLLLTQPNPLTMSVQVRNVLCFGDTTGQVTVTANAGTPPYTYRSDFNAYVASNVLTGIKAGQRLITVRDANGCLEDTTLNITEPTKNVITNITVTNPTCEGYTDGKVVISNTGGVTPYRYGYNNGSLSGGSTLSGLTEGDYVFHVEDQNGCRIDTSLKLQGYPHILINSVTPKDVSCFGMENGEIAVDAEGGVQPLNYLIGNQAPEENIFKGLYAASYTVSIVDSKGCRKDTTVTVGSPDKLSIGLTALKNDCEGLDDGGSISTKVQGGVLPYTYTWSTIPERHTQDITGLANGKYMVWVTDANDCQDSSVAEVLYNNCCKVFIPDAFTPNGDGKNDKVRILFKGDMTLKTFMIYNRFGQRVFMTDKLTDGWDGTFNGIPQDLGVYNYYVKGLCGHLGIEEVEYKGTITLIR
jgi:gliding motility-associated-like protein